MILGPMAFRTLDSIIDALYQSVSGPNRELDMALQRQIFGPDARLTRTGIGPDGRPWQRHMDLDAYEADTLEFFASTDFYEYETAREAMLAAPFAYVLSEYAAKSDPLSEEILLSGVNSLQCRFDGNRWWIERLLWNHRA